MKNMIVFAMLTLCVGCAKLTTVQDLETKYGTVHVIKPLIVELQMEKANIQVIQRRDSVQVLSVQKK
jgi:hypothetical protein